MKHILYHTDPDGFASGAIVRYALLDSGTPEDEIEMHPINYGMELPKIDYENDEAIMVDFSLQPYERMTEFAEKLGERLTWIDHHETSLQMQKDTPMLEDIRGLRAISCSKDGEFDVNEDDPKIAGCELTWMYYFPREPIPLFVELIGDWDTWRWKDIPDSKAPEYITYLNSADFDPQESFPWWKRMIEDELSEYGSTEETVEKMIRTGSLLLEYKRFQDKEKMEANSFEAYFAGHRAILINGSGNTEAFKGFYDPDRHDLMVNFQLGKEGYWTVGIFTETPDRVHCGRLAEELGHEGPIPSGGGHDGAAGFQTTWRYFNSLLDPEVPDPEVA